MFDDSAVVEYELEREKWNLDDAPTAPSSKTGCLMSIVYFLLGISLLRLVGELLSFGLHLIY